MQTEHEPEFAEHANRNGDEKVRGVRKLKPRTGRPKPWGVQWSERAWDAAAGIVRREVKTEFYSTETLRDDRYTELCRDKRNGQLATATRQEVAEWRAFQAATQGTPWQDVVAGWRAWLQQNGMTTHARVASIAVDDYLTKYAKLVEREQRTETSFKKVKLHLTRLAEVCGHVAINRVKGDDIEDWLDDLDDIESDATFNSYRRSVHALFEHYVERGELRKNPTDTVELRDELNEVTGVLSIDDTARLLDACQNFFSPVGGHRFRVILPRIALEVFAGLRTSAASRVAKTDINFADRGITLPKRNSKNRRRHYISGQPDTLWQWLELAEDRAWAPIDRREYRYLKSALFEAAGIPHPKNCLRHGFASYMLADCKDPGRVAYLLCHRNQDELWDHYNGRVAQSEARRFKTLSPAACRKIARRPRAHERTETVAADSARSPA